MRTAVIVEDEPVDRFIMAEVIRRSGEAWNVHSFPSVEKALNYISFQRAHGGNFPELILLDLLIPTMNGFEFLQTVRSYSGFNKSQTCIVAVTISGDPALHRKALALGAARVIPKPFTLEKWQEILELP